MSIEGTWDACALVVHDRPPIFLRTRAKGMTESMSRTSWFVAVGFDSTSNRNEMDH